MSADQMTYFTLEIFTEARVLEKESTDIRELNKVTKLRKNYQNPTP